ncbi:hypothetical protein D3C79_1067870 [compost metagenome]
MDPELFFEPANGRGADAADGILHRTEAGSQAFDQTADNHSTELGETGWHVDTEIAQHAREGLVDQADRAEIGEHSEDA